MPFYLVSISDSDGNDNTILDYTVEADSKADAVEKTADAVEARAKENGIGMESDGGFGWFYHCDCDIPEAEEETWECSHGGITINDGEEAVDGPFDSESEARKARHELMLDCGFVRGKDSMGRVIYE